MDMIQGIPSLLDSSIQRRMDIEIEIFILHWVLTLNSHYGTKLGLNGFFAVQPLGEIRPKRLSIAVFAETELARHGGSVESLPERRIVRWVLCMRKTEEIDQATKRSVVGSMQVPKCRTTAGRMT